MTQTNLLRQLLLLLILCGWAEAAEQIRCALIVDKNEELRSSALVSLLEARLSQDNRLQLLERAQIDAILREQQVSLAGATEPNMAVKVGRLLRADAFILLSVESPGGEDLSGNPPNGRGRAIEEVDSTSTPDGRLEPVGQLLRVRVVETTHGLRLSDRYEQLDKSDVQATADRIAGRVRITTQKIGQPVGQVIPVGIVDIHRVQLPDRYERLARILPGLLSARLSVEPRILMLERENLGTLLEEKQLTDGNDSAFWNSAILIDGYLHRGDQGIEVSLRLRRGNGEGLSDIKALVDPNAPFAAADMLAIEMAKTIPNATLSVPWDAAKEAEEFYRQGQLLFKNHRYSAAVTLFETAHALQPTNVFHTGALFLNEWYARFDRSTRKYRETGLSFYSDQEVEEIVSTLVRQIRDGYEKGELSRQDVLTTWGEPLGLDYWHLDYFGSAVSVSTPSIRALNRENRAIWVNTVRHAIKGSGDPTKPIELAWTSSDVPEEVVANLREAFADLSMRQAAETDPSLANSLYCLWRTWFLSWYEYWRVCLLFPQSPSGPGLEKTQFRDATDQFKQVWPQYLIDLSADPYPITRYLGCLALCDWFSRPEGADKEKSEFYRHKAIEIATGEITNDGHVSDLLKSNVIFEIKQKPYVTPAEFQAMLESLIAEHDVKSIVMWDPGQIPRWHFTRDAMDQFRDWYESYGRLLNRISELLQSEEKDGGIKIALVNIKNFESNKGGLYAAVATPRASPVSNGVTVLFKNDVRSQRNLFATGWSRVERQENMLWVAGFSSFPIRSTPGGPMSTDLNVRLIGLDLKGRELVASWQARVSLPDSTAVPTRLSGIVMGTQSSYVSVPGLGLVEFPGSLAKGNDVLPHPRVYGQENGLPSVLITAVAKDKAGRLWLAYGDKERESGLGVYEPNAGHWDTVFCSSLKGQPPFNEDLPYKIYSLMPGPDNTIYFLVLDPGEYWRTDRVRNCDGLWKLNTDTRLTTYLGPFWQDDVVQWLDTETSPGTLWFKAFRNLVAFDINSETMQFLLGDPTHLMELRSKKKAPLCKFEFVPFIPEASMRRISFGNSHFEAVSAAIQVDQLWAPLGPGQVMVFFKGKPYEQARIIDNTLLDGEPVLRFVGTPYGLVAIGIGTVGLIEMPDAAGRYGKEKRNSDANMP